ncbi:MAG: HupE/UreJ family protein [Methylocystis sp.]|uniref:HupE/UreJ family protein n=1 Tax=Methylocystis sp. TaxID=1911079 RepID=UPI003DA349E4
MDGRWKDTFAFGFTHGFSFASGLIELGVPQRAVVAALASFNIGVEIGQIGVILIVIPILFLMDRLFPGAAAKPVVALQKAVVPKREASKKKRNIKAAKQVSSPFPKDLQSWGSSPDSARSSRLRVARSRSGSPRSAPARACSAGLRRSPNGERHSC